jgi:hypothetical protein
VDELRRACAAVAQQAESVRVQPGAIAAYAGSLRTADPATADLDNEHPSLSSREQLAAFWLTLDAVNFGSGWFPTLRKAQGLSGYGTIATALSDHVREHGPWSAAGLRGLDGATVARTLGQARGHELMGLYANSLNDLGTRIERGYGGSFSAFVDVADGSAVALARRLGSWPCFADSSRYRELEVPFLKRAQIAAADLQRAGVAAFADLPGLTMFADNLVAHVLRLDGVLGFEPELVARIDRGELLEHGSPEEVEIRACALHAVELIVAARPGPCAAEVDQLLWLRGQQPTYKARPRHRCRCTAY